SKRLTSVLYVCCRFFFSSRRRHTRFSRDWSSDVCSSDLLHGLFFVVFLGTYLAEKLENLKLAPPPDLTAPDIAEWSKPLPPDQWAKRSTELERAIREREAQLAVEAEVV